MIEDGERVRAYAGRAEEGERSVRMDLSWASELYLRCDRASDIAPSAASRTDPPQHEDEQAAVTVEGLSEEALSR